VRGVDVLHTVEYCGTLDTERQEKQRKQIVPNTTARVIDFHMAHNCLVC
jgi:hypothetical protein